VKITSAQDQILQVSELAVWDVDNVNVALGKPCTSSPPLQPGTTCNLAFQGVYQAESMPRMYHSASNGAFLQVDLGANYAITRVDFYHRIDSCCQSQMNGALIELLDANSKVLASRTIDGPGASASFDFAHFPTTTTSTTTTTKRTSKPLTTSGSTTIATCLSLWGRPDGCPCTFEAAILCASQRCVNNYCGCSVPMSAGCACVSHSQCASGLCDLYDSRCASCKSNESCALYSAAATCDKADTADATCK
jgi:hypothetical protein